VSPSVHVGLAVALFLGIAPSLRGAPQTHAGEGDTAAPPTAAVQALDTLLTRWLLQPEGSEARYRVREQLAGFDFPNDAVGTTSAVSGSILVTSEGAVVPDGSVFRVDLASLATDNDRRDNYVRQRTLEVEEYPEAVLVPRRFVGLPFPLPETGAVRFQLEADLTLHGVTAPTVWEIMAQVTPASITGLASTSFTFDTFGIAVPRVARVLSVADDIRLELEFRMAPESD
jgi:polyisoprenoid-binding protein YceI